MDRMPEVLEDIFIYGSGALPATNFFLSEYPTHKTWKHFVLVFKNIWSGNYPRALEHIDIAIKTCSQDSAKYILLAKKLFLLSLTGKLDRSLFLLLKRSVNRLSQRSRDIVLCTLLNMEAKGISHVRCTRVWSSKYQKDTPEAAFVHINLARRYASQKRLSDSVHHFVKAYRIASSIPHPSGIITALNGIAWDIRERHTKFAYKFAKVAVYYLGFFREDFGNLTGVLDSLFDIENRMKLQEIYKTAIVLSSIQLPNKYVHLKERSKNLSPTYSENTYKNTRKLRNFLKKILGPYRSESLSPSRTSEIVTGKTSFIRSDTLQKLIEGKDIDIYTCPYPVYNELIKKRIKKDFEKAIMTLQDMKFKDRLCLFLSTFTALVDRSKFYLSRKDKFLEAFVLLKRKKDIPRFKEYMSKRYETMLFVINMIEPHPYIKGRRDAAKKFFSRLSSKRLETFAKVYAGLREGNRKVMDRFLRNYGRYEVMRLRTRLKGPQVIREFAKRYRARVQPAFAAYWTESDGRVRRHVEYLAGRFVEKGF